MAGIWKVAKNVPYQCVRSIFNEYGSGSRLWRIRTQSKSGFWSRSRTRFLALAIQISSNVNLLQFPFYENSCGLSGSGFSTDFESKSGSWSGTHMYLLVLVFQSGSNYTKMEKIKKEISYLKSSLEGGRLLLEPERPFRGFRRNIMCRFWINFCTFLS